MLGTFETHDIGNRMYLIFVSLTIAMKIYRYTQNTHTYITSIDQKVCSCVQKLVQQIGKIGSPGAEWLCLLQR